MKSMLGNIIGYGMLMVSTGFYCAVIMEVVK